MLCYLIFIFKYAIGPYREMTRLYDCMKSPILTHLGESIQGNSTIRAFKRESEFRERNYEDLNKQILINQVALGTFIWYSNQMNMISIIMLAFSTTFCVIFKEDIHPVLLAMVFQYVLGLHDVLIGFFHCLSDVEKQLVGVQRCLQLQAIPQEKFGQKKIEDKSWPSQGKIEFKDV